MLGRYCVMAMGLLLAAATTSLRADESTDIVVEHTAAISTEHVGTRRVAVDLGALPAGQIVVLDLTVTNPFDTALAFVTPSDDCHCLGITSSSNRFDPHDVVHFRIRWKTPPRSLRAAQHLSIVLGPDLAAPPDSVPVELAIDYELAGLIAVVDRHAVVEIAPDEPIAERLLNVVITDPIQRENLRVEPSAELSAVGCEVVEAEGMLAIRVTCPRTAVADGPISGELFLTDAVTGGRDACWLTIQLAERVKISPRLVRFSKAIGEAPSSEPRGLVAVAALQVRAMTDKAEHVATADMQVTCTWGGFALPVSCATLGSPGIYRISVVLPYEVRDQVKNATSETGGTLPPLMWSIELDDGRFVAESRVMVDD
jgi:hypothetical protein